MRAIPTVILVSTKFVVVIFTEVKVPATNKSPERYIFAPVIVCADNNEVLTVPNEPIVECKVAVVIPVDKYKVPALIELDNKLLMVDNPIDKYADDIFVDNKDVVVIDSVPTNCE